MLRRSRALDAALGEPLLSRWSFDVELLGHLLVGGAGARAITEAQILEIPLNRCDVPGSKLRPRAMAGALKGLAEIASEFRDAAALSESVATADAGP